MLKKFFVNLKKFYPLYEDNKKYFWGIILLSIGICLISIINPALFSRVITYMLHKKYLSIIYVLLLLAFCQLLSMFFNILSSKYFFLFRRNFVLELRKKVANSIFNLDVSTFSLSGKGKYIQRIINDPGAIADNLGDFRIYFMALITNIGTVGYIVYLNIYVGLIYLITFIIVLYIRVKAIKIRYIRQNTFCNEQDESNSILTELLNGFRDVKLLNMQKSFSKKTDKKFSDLEKIKYMTDFRYDLCLKITKVIEWCATGLVIILCIFLIKTKLMSIDDFVVITMYRTNIFPFLDYITDLLNRLSSFNLASDRIFELTELNKEQNKINKQIKIKGNIEFKNVVFKYDNENVLNKCNFKINAGESVILLGDSGAGKTTILNLIAHIYDIQDGSILVDNTNINDIDDTFLRKNISIISQTFYLFDMSIKDNLMIAKPNMTNKEMIDVCKKVKINDFIQSLPQKYNTIIGEGGFTLSGGQRQRIAIARTLLLNSKIILFDEVTSSLDKKLETTIMDIIKDINKNNDHTIIFVTHNLDLIKYFDKQLMIKNGKVKIKDIVK